VAVAVDACPHAVLDENLRIVESSWAGPNGHVGPGCGHGFIELFSGSRSVILPYLDEARRTGRVVTFARYFDGYLAEVRIVPDGRTLSVSCEPLAVLDVLTLDGLRTSLDAALELLSERGETLRREVVRSSLRVVEGYR
jgi:hypothetical protein